MHILLALVICSVSIFAAGCGGEDKEGEVTQTDGSGIQSFADHLEETLRNGSEDEFHQLMVSQFASFDDYRMIFTEEISDEKIEKMVSLESEVRDMIADGRHKPGEKMLGVFQGANYSEREVREYDLAGVIKAGVEDEQLFYSREKRLGHWAEDEFFKSDVKFVKIVFSEPEAKWARSEWGPSRSEWGPYFWNGDSWKSLAMFTEDQVYLETKARVRNGRGSVLKKMEVEGYDALSAEERLEVKSIEDLREAVGRSEENVRKARLELADFEASQGRYLGMKSNTVNEIAEQLAQLESEVSSLKATDAAIAEIRSDNPGGDHLAKALKKREQISLRIKEGKAKLEGLEKQRVEGKKLLEELRAKLTKAIEKEEESFARSRESLAKALERVKE